MSFLKAEWRKLALANYVIDPEVLKSYVPAGTELDLWNGKCYVSLVGFMFINTRLLGIKIPFHINFEEVNLRFYVKRIENGEIKRGVVFIKEIVPLPSISMVANTVYKEHYQTLPMRHFWQIEDEIFLARYEWKVGKKWQSFEVKAYNTALAIPEGSEVEFITEHYWGYSKVNNSKTNEYQVTHPRWLHYEIENFKIQVDFGMTYGSDFSFLNKLEPKSVMLAEGSEITVEGQRKINVIPNIKELH